MQWSEAEQRHAASIADKYSNRDMHIIVVHSDPAKITLKKRKFVTGNGITGAQLMTIVRKHSSLDAKKAAFLLFRDTQTLIPMSDLISSHQHHIDSDGVLHIVCSTENAFG